MAQASVSMSSASFQEQIKVTPNGEKTYEWVKAEKIVPGTVIRYVNTLSNSGKKKATKLVVKNSIPKHMEYIANSAACENGCKLLYSVDNGKNFKMVSELYVGEAEERHLAKAFEYTDIMWIVNALTAKTESFVEYKARLK